MSPVLVPRPRVQDTDPPAGVYLSTLGPTSRRTQAVALTIVGRWLCPGAGGPAFVPWEQLGYQHVALVRERMVEEGYAPATINRWLAALRGVARQAWLLGLMPLESYERIRQVPGARGTRLPPGRAPDAGEIRRVMDAAGPRDRAGIALLYGAGLRVAEACSLEIGRVHLGRRVLRVVGKGDKEREVPLAPFVVRALEAWYAVRGGANGPVLTTAAGEPMHPNSLASALERAARRAGVEDVTPHDLRRAFVSHLLGQGSDLATVQALAGHSDPRTTARYDRRGEDARRKAVDGLEA